MATIGAEMLTLLDAIKRQKPDGGQDTIAEMLNEDQEILDDMPWVEANSTLGHQTTIRAGLPDVAWRQLNAGVARSKSEVVQITDTPGILAAYSEVDKDLADMSGNKAQFRMNESKAFIESMGQEFASTLFYGNTDTDPEKFLGLAPRYSSLSAGNSDMIINEGDSSNLTSIFLVHWDPNEVFGIYPKGTMAGLHNEDLGQKTLEDSAGNQFEGYRSYFTWKCGLCVRNWQNVVRIANIDSTQLTADASTGPNLINLMSQAVERIKSTNGRTAFYCSRTIREYLRLQATNKANVQLSIEKFYGRTVPAFDGLPIRKTDAITTTETAVS